MTNYAEMLDKIEALFIVLGEEVLALRQYDALEVTTKLDHTDLVTAADRLVETRLTELISTHWPSHSIRGEEGIGSVRRNSGFEWILDPIDGTNPYASGMNHFSLSAGLTENGNPVAGILCFPAQKKVLRVVRGQGVLMNESSLKIKDCGPFLTGANLGFDFSMGGDRDQERELFFRPVQGPVRYTFILGTFTGTLLAVLENQLAAYVNPGATCYDLGAGLLIAEEAGCAVAGFKGKPIDLSRPKSAIIVARNKELLRALDDLLPESLYV